MNLPINDGGIYTPEELAWKLIIDENIDYEAAIMAFADENSKETLFEILITIYIEMVFDYYKIKYLENIIDKNEFESESESEFDEFDNFELNLQLVSLDTLTDIFSNKFKLIKYLLNVHEIPYEHYDYIKKNRYCTVLLKDSPTDELYFEFNKDKLDSEKRYHFVLNSLYLPVEELRDIFCSFSINNKYYKISFMSSI